MKERKENQTDGNRDTVRNRIRNISMKKRMLSEKLTPPHKKQQQKNKIV